MLHRQPNFEVKNPFLHKLTRAQPPHAAYSTGGCASSSAGLRDLTKDGNEAAPQPLPLLLSLLPYHPIGPSHVGRHGRFEPVTPLVLRACLAPV
jgi:hypothetical protein